MPIFLSASSADLETPLTLVVVVVVVVVVVLVVLVVGDFRPRLNCQKSATHG